MLLTSYNYINIIEINLNKFHLWQYRTAYPSRAPGMTPGFSAIGVTF